MAAPIGDLLSPLQLGFGTAKIAEAAVHVGRLFLANSASDKVLLKLNFKNAFNSVRRDKMLEAVQDLSLRLWGIQETQLCVFW